MKKTLRGKLTYSNVISTLCLFLLLGGGTAFAASQLGKNSVGSKQLKMGAVTPAKLSTASKAALTGPTGLRGPQGPQGAKGDRGEVGPEGSLPATLPSGKTIVGAFDLGGTAAGASSIAVTDISYNYTAPGQTVTYVSAGSTDATCTGSAAAPTAPPGNTCVYEIAPFNLSGDRGINFTKDTGVGLFATSEAAGVFEDSGTWAVTGN